MSVLPTVLPRTSARAHGGEQEAHVSQCLCGVLADGDEQWRTVANYRETEGVGFEPTREREPPAGFQDRCLKPLGHPSLAPCLRHADSRLGREIRHRTLANL